jgi:hypothetical protein
MNGFNIKPGDFRNGFDIKILGYHVLSDFHLAFQMSFGFRLFFDNLAGFLRRDGNFGRNAVASKRPLCDS